MMLARNVAELMKSDNLIGLFVNIIRPKITDFLSF